MTKSENSAYRKTVLPNGARIITETIPHVRSVSLGLWVDVGSRDETIQSSGISHFIEHMVFKGTDTRRASEIASYLESVGGVLNAFTGREQTCYYAKFLDQHIDKAVEILFDLINNAVFDRQDIEKEKKVILEEIHDIEDSPSDLVHDLFAAAIFGKHPLGRSILGSRNSVISMNRPKVLRYRSRFYRPDKIIVAACGNLEHDHLVELTTRYINPRVLPAARNGRRKPSFKPNRRTYRRKTNQTHVCLGIPAREFVHESRTAMLLLNSVLGGGMSSRLFQRLREDLGLVYSVFSFLDFFADNGVFGIYLGTDKNNIRKALIAVKSEIEAVIADRLDAAEIEKAREQLKGSLMLGLENTSNRMNRLAKHELLANKYISLDETVSAIDGVTADEILEMARELFWPGQFSAVVLGPVKGDVYTALE
jgi:predicted Zn-dependent peptidase